MISRSQRLSLDLPDQAVFTLPDAHQVDIECRQGALWITLDNDPRDIVLAPGEHFHAESHKRALVTAVGESSVRFSGERMMLAPGPPPAARSPSPWRLWSHGMSPA